MDTSKKRIEKKMQNWRRTKIDFHYRDMLLLKSNSLREGRENIQEGIVPFKLFDDNKSDHTFCSPLTLDGIGLVRKLDEKSKESSCVQLLLKDKNSSRRSKLLFRSDNTLIFSNLKNCDIVPLRWLLPRSKNSMLVRFHRGLGIGQQQQQHTQEAVSERPSAQVHQIQVKGEENSV
ncbi:hypothetical protein H5410_000313 [Solanum commersonii]|uniref:Uncharacterized protein n=1 Tax=Solanum commersonii TaxID=4109 RepID=A0A9J6AVX6_SOLCO|nr:hypothetical protein H5410_000313 [Solanum commersonii]